MTPNQIKTADTYKEATYIAAADVHRQARILHEEQDWSRSGAISGALDNVMDDSHHEANQLADHEVTREEYEEDIAGVARRML